MSGLELAPLAQLGAAGLMGALWVWERNLTRCRERELSEAHERLMVQREALQELVALVGQNARALEGFEQTQNRLARAVERLAARGA
ncbi:hypothetical protein [Mucisphaera calidilacus]|uniref:Uncharacterized protein n=1 Tax=Mucisphaera calidilacus TaxID=2527982 RepID=A0A518C0U2_9BACT|nr:hypothetical protein [Mucisphaera calidilacus]QDU72814.1 hypothetical protein Pan265_26880 [Mucisphaera calidilacus]